MAKRGMLSQKEFVDFILNGQGTPGDKPAKTSGPSDLPDGFEGFDDGEAPGPPSQPAASFARRLLEASGFGYPEMLQRDNVIRSTDAVARHLPDRVAYWPQTTSRKYHTLLFETDLTDGQLLSIPAFRSRKMAHLGIVEDALARLVSEALAGFQHGGEGVTANVRMGRMDETLCLISIVDSRDSEQDPVRLVCFGTKNKSTGSLETFHVAEQTRFWDPVLAREHLRLLYDRQFKKLAAHDWQEAFTTSEERKLADKLLAVCMRRAPKEHDIETSVLDLLDAIAKSFGLRKHAKSARVLLAFKLPADHSIGIDSENREGGFGGKNLFGGVTLRDARSRLLGYIVYPLNSRSDASRLRKHLEKNNRFHNVLVVYPDEDQACLELWQGQEQLTGKLRKGQGYKDAADVVNLLSRFFVVSKAKVRNPTELAQELAYRARYLRRLAVKQLEDELEKGPLRNLYNAFKEALVHDQTEEEFADAFAQTITYGLLTARWTSNDELMAKGERLTRQTALKHLPAASPFLNALFESVLSVKLDDQRGRLLWLVDDIADLLDRIDVTYVFGLGAKGSDMATDPVVHFYEPFLAAYDKDLKNKRGVFFTPRPVVSYIVRSVHEVLQKEFGLEDGLASTDTWGDVAKRIKSIKVPAGVKASCPFVCILDPATGTGTFLFECIDVIERTMKDRWCRDLKKDCWQDPAVLKQWNVYVSKHLLPRLFGYELMMSSYAVAHLKLAFKLQETGYAARSGTGGSRINVYLTNTLEQSSKSGRQKLSSIFAALAHEAASVSVIKESQRFTVVVGNPPYAGVSANNNDWVNRLVGEYYFVDGAPLGERNPKWLQDDYVKFIRFGQEVLRQSECGVFGYITNHGYVDNPTFRGMRQSLLQTFTKIRVLDLHGNTKKKETCPDGAPDQNVFDIQQGVAILIASALPRNAHALTKADLFGSRAHKYSILAGSTANSTRWQSITAARPFYVFVCQDGDIRAEYGEFVSIKEIMPVNVLGFQTHRDHFAIALEKSAIVERCEALRDGRISIAELKKRYQLKDNRDWSVSDARKSISADKSWKEGVIECHYRPFDVRWCYFSQATMDYPRRELLDHVARKDNLCLLVPRQISFLPWQHVGISRFVAESCFVSNKTKEQNYNFPLHLYPAAGASALRSGRRPNIGDGYLRELQTGLGTAGSGSLLSEDILAYIYAILHSATYRSRYAEFLKMDFPRLPRVSSRSLYDGLAAHGRRLIALHLLEEEMPQRALPRIVGNLSRVVEKISWSANSVWVDRKKTCGFSGVTEEAWSFEVGCYRVCEKWLKDRKGRPLAAAEIHNYQKIVAAITETIKLRQDIDKVIDAHGGWPGAFAAKSGEGKK